MLNKISTENKRYWIQHGEEMENKFAQLYPWAIVNPQKEENPYLPDLLIQAELKYRTMPFFLADVLYRKDPQYTVTFNKKDYEYYRDQFPAVVIIFWVDWQLTEWRGCQVKPMKGIWITPFPRINHLVCEGVPLHIYKKRKEDKVNAQESYLFDLRDFDAL